MADPITNAEAQVAGFVLSKTGAAIGFALTLLLGIGLAEGFERTFKLDFLIIHLEGMGMRLASADADKAKAVAAVQANLTTCQENTNGLRSTLGALNIAIKTQSDAAQKKLSDNAAAVTTGIATGAEIAKRQANLNLPISFAATSPPTPAGCLMKNEDAEKLAALHARMIAP